MCPGATLRGFWNRLDIKIYIYLAIHKIINYKLKENVKWKWLFWLTLVKYFPNQILFLNFHFFRWYWWFRVALIRIEFGQICLTGNAFVIELASTVTPLTINRSAQFQQNSFTSPKWTCTIIIIIGIYIALNEEHSTFTQPMQLCGSSSISASCDIQTQNRTYGLGTYGTLMGHL